MSDLGDLEARIDAAQDKHKPKEESELSKTLNAGMEFTAPILGGILIGYGLDRWLETKPIFILSLFLLGVGAGFVNIYKASQNIGGTIGYSELHQREKNAKTSQNADSEREESEKDA
ncbi:MAG: AtpZ/AtpI family protein [Alphaproteobacteria bacterium]|nr:AtpZ/AtpI family protein [Alphaproteobacteria bacterium]